MQNNTEKVETSEEKFKRIMAFNAKLEQVRNAYAQGVINSEEEALIDTLAKKEMK